MDAVVYLDNEETEQLCLALDANGTPSPLVNVSWTSGWREGAISAAHVVEAARSELGFECE